MTKSTKRSIIVSSVLAIVMCVSLMAGATFALFTSESKMNIAVTSGTVQVEAAIGNLAVYSPTAISTAAGNEITDDTNAADTTTNTFKNGGTASVADNTITLANITPGDKVTFTVTVTNKSNVKTKYRTIVSKVALSDDSLFNVLKCNIGGATVEKSTVWKNLDPATSTAGDTVATYDCAVELPTTASVTGASCSFACVVEAVQGNAETSNTNAAIATTATATLATTDVTTASDGTKTVANAIEVKSNDAITVQEGEEVKAVTMSSVVVPVGVKLDSTATELILDVAETEEPNFTVEGGQTKTFEISMSGIASDNTQPVTVKYYVGTGFADLTLKHGITAMNKKTTLAEVTSDQDYYYDSTTGFVTMMTATFSPFTVEYKGKVVETAKAFADAVVNAVSGDIIKLGADIEVSATDYNVSNRLAIIDADNVTIDLNGKTLTASNHTLTFIGENITLKNGNMVATTTSTNQTYGSYAVAVSGKNATIDSVKMLGGVNVNGYNSQDCSIVYEGVSATITNCEITSTNYYAVCTQGEATATVKNSTLIVETGVAVFWIEKAFTDELGTVGDSSLSYEKNTVTITGAKASTLYKKSGLAPTVIE